MADCFLNCINQASLAIKKDCAVLSDVPIEQAEAIHKWLGEVINATKQGEQATIAQADAPRNHHLDNILLLTTKQKAVQH